MADYKWNGSTEESGVTRYVDGASIPNAVGNRDWNEYLKYVEEGGLTDPYQSAEEAKDEMVVAIDTKNREENKKDFPYNGNMYVADIESIQAVAIEASTMTPTDPIPTPNGVWKTADKDAEGLPVYVAYTCGEYADFKSAFYMRSSDNFGVKEFHKNNVKTMYNNGATAEEIKAYDYSQGWV